MKIFLSKYILVLFLINSFANLLLANNADTIHVWEMKEIKFNAENDYKNSYMDVTIWVELKGPNFEKRVYGFWDGGNNFVVRIVATEPGNWKWKSFSNKNDDNGLNNKSGSFNAIDWTEEEKNKNPNRRGFLRATKNGHALQYADGNPFFMVGDTWLAGSTWRLPFRNAKTNNDYKPSPGIGFEDAVMFRKNQGFNSVSMISCFPNWDSDIHPSTYADSNNIFIRNAWEKFGYDVSEAKGIDASGGLSYWGTFTSKNMRDEFGNLPFEMSRDYKGVSDFTKINPEYFKSLDKKMEFLSQQGFVSLLETVRRDVGPSWKAYFDFDETFARFFQYLISRYGAYNIVFSGIHLDWIPKDFSLTAQAFNEALTYHLENYGSLPFGQPVTSLISSSTHSVFGHYKDCPWLTMHSVGNKPRDHRVADSLEIIFKLNPPYPAINFEPYYTGWNHEINKPNGERPQANSERDNYFARAQMYGSVLSGGLSGHVHGTAAYDITTTGEPNGARPHFWEALQYESANYMKHLNSFIFSEGNKFQNLLIARDDVVPNKTKGSPQNGLDGWIYMMRNSEKDFALLYFENKSEIPILKNFLSQKEYFFSWYNTISGEWLNKVIVESDAKGTIIIPNYLGNVKISSQDWAAKIYLINNK
ncbi:MAG: DUF4038 domain-containing protein [Ignavibacteriae bacterium]|nr:DUF4038 domain-containing protein [Ignavibacteriota bacterium]